MLRFGCVREMIRILKTVGGNSRSPEYYCPPFLSDGSGDIRVLPFPGPAYCCWHERFTSLRLSLEISAQAVLSNPEPGKMLGSRVLPYL